MRGDWIFCHPMLYIITHVGLIFPPGMPYGFVRIFLFFFVFFRRQGFQMIIFDRQAGPLQNFNRSHIMVIGRSVSFSDPARPKHPKIPPPPSEIFLFFLHAFQNPRNIFDNKILVGKKNSEIFRPPPPPKKIFFFFIFFLAF